VLQTSDSEGESGVMWQKRNSAERCRKSLWNQLSRFEFLPLLALLLSGCAEVPREEYAYQAIHLVDVAQTVQIARSSCFHENHSAMLIGDHPSVSGALAWGLGFAAGHALITKEMRRHDWPQWLQWTWQSLTVGAAAYDVKNNHDQGIGVAGSDC
jgi:hypothetical protein